MAVVLVAFLTCLTQAGEPNRVTFQSLMDEMSDWRSLARLPDPPYRALQATSYNRDSVARDKPGWFADSDGTGFIRTETLGGKTEWVLMEDDGPGCITRMWTPFFYYDFNDRVGPNVRVYIDGQAKPSLDEPLIRLLTGHGSIPRWFADETARAGLSYFPIPYGKSCKVTTTSKPFYYSLSYRSYPRGTRVESFSTAMFHNPFPGVHRLTGRERAKKLGPVAKDVPPGGSLDAVLPKGSWAVTSLDVKVPAAKTDPSLLRSLVMSASFDGEETVWCPLGDFFGSPDEVNPTGTASRTTHDKGWFMSTWAMPYRKTGRLSVVNLSLRPVRVDVQVESTKWSWDDRSMHFHANWRPDDVVPGTPFQDWNFIDIHGRGVYVGDAWTVLNPQKDTWWGEGDEKVYVDDAWDQGFPTHFGTGTEDYYGWAGGVLPTKADSFIGAFCTNVKVGGIDGHTQGFNVCMRDRGLDAIPFDRRLRFDMESSFGTDIRNPWNLLGYSAVTFWYARPGATHNRPPMPEAARKPIMSVVGLQKMSDAIRAKGGR